MNLLNQIHESENQRPHFQVSKIMASFYGNNSVSKSSITEALGFTPSTYALVEENGIAMLRASDDSSFSNQVPLISFEITDGIPTLYITVGQQKYRFIESDYLKPHIFISQSQP